MVISRLGGGGGRRAPALGWEFILLRCYFAGASHSFTIRAHAIAVVNAQLKPNIAWPVRVT
eukprot:scaffold21092_cov71-Skeletonema_marinoi.AAC.1